MDRWKQLIASLRMAPPTDQPWYRRPDIWLLAAAVVLPFGWILPLARFAWLSVSTRAGETESPRIDDSPGGAAAQAR